MIALWRVTIGPTGVGKTRCMHVHYLHGTREILPMIGIESR